MGVKPGNLPWLLILAVFLAQTLMAGPGFSPFPNENEYVWCFAKRTLPARLGSDISGAGITSLHTFPAYEIRGECGTGVPFESYSECRRLSFHLADLRADWKNALDYSNSRDIWTGFSSINNAEAAVLKYSQALSSARDLDDAILSEIDSLGLKKISGLVGESGKGETFLSIHSTLSLSRQSREIERDLSDARLFHSQIISYYSAFRGFSENLHASYIFRTNCSALANWSLFECSSPGWALLNIACAGNPVSCVLATDCEATVSNNITSLRAYLPDFGYFWDKNRGERISSALWRYSEYSELYLKAEKIYAEKLEDSFLLSRQVEKLLSEARSERLGEIPAILQFGISRGFGESEASFYESGNISERIALSERALHRFSDGISSLSGKSLGERIISLDELRAELLSAKQALESAIRHSSMIERNLDELVPEDKLREFLYLPAGLRILSKQALVENERGQFMGLFEVACAPRGTKFPEFSINGIEREGEGLSPEKCASSPTNEALLLALSEEYEARVNGLRWQARLIAGEDEGILESIRKYEFLASNGWISAKNAWGFLSLAEREYSRAISLSPSTWKFSFSEELVRPLVSNREIYSRIYGDVRPPEGFFGKQVSRETFFSAFSARTGKYSPAHLRELWAVGGCAISSSQAGPRTIDFSFECETSRDTANFLFERSLGIVAESRETYSSEATTSEEYSAVRKYSLDCNEIPTSREIAINTGLVLPEDRVSVEGAGFFSDKGSVFVLANCSDSGKTIEARVKYSNPIEVSLLFGAPGKATLSARNLLGIPLKNAKIFFALPKNSSKIFVGGVETYPSAEGISFYEVDLSPGEAKSVEVSFSGASEYLPPDCPFCCGLEGRFNSLPKEKQAEAVNSLPKTIDNYLLLSLAPNREKVSKLACRNSFREALLLSDALILSEREAREKEVCLEISSSAISDRRAISALKSRTEGLRILRKKFPFGNFEDAPDLSKAALLVSEAERDCNETTLSEAEEEIERASTRADLAIESAALWAHSEFSESVLGPEITGKIVSAVERKVGNRTRTLFSGRRLKLPETPIPSEYGAIINSVVAASGEIAPSSELARQAHEAVSNADRLGEKSTAGILYLEKAKKAVVENRLLDGYFLGHYSAILSENDASVRTASGNRALKIGVALFSIALAAGIIFAGKSRNRRKSKELKGDSLFGEIR